MPFANIFSLITGHYYSLFKYTSAISRFSLRPISPALCKALLQELLSVVSINDHSEYVISTKSTSLLCHIDLESYSRETLEKRLFWLSLAHLSSPMRSDLLESSRDSLLWRILESPHAHLWALATSNCDEQYFLNTCDTAARLSSIVSYHYCIASLIHLGRVLSQCVEQRLKLASKTLPAYPAFWGSSPSQYDHSNAILTSVREVLNQLEQDIRTLLDSEKISAQEGEEARDFTRRDITNDKEVVLEMVLVRHEFVRRWQREMQKLSSIFFPENPVVLTEKTFKNDWHKSAKWMTARAFIEQLIVPGVPTFLSRSEASRTLEQISCDYLHTHHHLVDPEDDKSMWLDFPWSVAEENNEETKTSILERLWNRVAFLDGALISSREQLFFGYWEIGHLSYWKAVWMGQKYFLISDPELQYFKVLSIDQAVKFVSDIKSRVNPLDGSVQQHYRARRLCREEST